VPAKVTKVACQSCGANLNIDETIRFVTCGYCDAQLEIVQDSSTVHSKLLEDVVRRQEAVEDELRILRLEKQIQRLETEWESFRQRVCTKVENGTLIEPSKFGSILFGSIAGVIGVLGLAAAASSTDRWPIGLLAIVAMFLSYFFMKHGIRRADEFAAMRTRYLQKLSKLKGELSSAERDHRMPPMKRSGTPSRRLRIPPTHLD
jgi:hypothetical protein